MAAAASMVLPAAAVAAAPTVEVEFVGPDDEANSSSAVAAGAVRTAVVSSARTGKVLLLRSIGAMAANPHKLFRPENPSLSRFEDALDTFIRRVSHGTADSAAGTLHHGRRAQVPLTSRSLLRMWQNHGVRKAAQLKMRNLAINCAMGTVLFGTYDLSRSVLARRSGIVGPQPIAHSAQAACIAGAVHGTLCAPLEVASSRFLRYDPSPVNSQGLGRRSDAAHVWKALRLTSDGQASPAGLQERGPPFRGSWRMLRSALLPLSALRDGCGICAFFVTFEESQVLLRYHWNRSHHILNSQGWGDEERRFLSCGHTFATLLAGGSAGMAYRVAAWPWDSLLLRATAQCEVGGPILQLHASARALVEEVGWRRALLPEARAVLSAFPTSAVGLLIYEWLR